VPSVRPELLRAATWRAARYGLQGDLLDVVEVVARPAAELVERLLDRLRPALCDLGDWEEVSGLVRSTLSDGTGADRQRRVLADTGDPRAVVDFVVEATARGRTGG
jgi:carboxylate-amine ligase